jgi:hypothetical protein
VKDQSRAAADAGALRGPCDPDPLQGCDVSVLLDGEGGGPRLVAGRTGAGRRGQGDVPGRAPSPAPTSWRSPPATPSRSSSGGRFSDEADATRLPNPKFVFPVFRDSSARRGLGMADLADVALSNAHMLRVPEALRLPRQWRGGPVHRPWLRAGV